MSFDPSFEAAVVATPGLYTRPCSPERYANGLPLQPQENICSSQIEKAVHRKLRRAQMRSTKQEQVI